MCAVSPPIPELMCLVSISLSFPHLTVSLLLSTFFLVSKPSSFCTYGVMGRIISWRQEAITLSLPFIFTYKLATTLVCPGVEVYICMCA